MHACLVETLNNALLMRSRAASTTRRHLAEPEDTLDHAEFRGRRVQARHCQPVVHDHAGADDGRAAVDAAGDEGHLQERGELVLVADGGLGVHDSALV